MKRVGIDVGGTFTDVVVYDEATARLERFKVLSTPHTPEEGILGVFAEAGLDAGAIAYLIHGTTIVTNLIIERKGARVGLLTTRGFRDVLEIMRATREQPYDLHWVQPQPLVPRHLRLEVDERIGARGQVVLPLDEGTVQDAARALIAEGVDAIAICFLHAYANSAHEERARAAVRDLGSNIPVTISSEVCREIREYERTSTTVFNAYAMPRFDAYVARLGAAIKTRHGIKYMNSEGGVVASHEARALPMTLCLSGPAGGVLAGQFLGRELGLPNLITLDMGGTSLDVCVIRDGQPQRTSTQHVQWGIPIRTPAIDVKTIGAGGGSIVWIDAGGAVGVGPRSAGADPGPACYGRGGTELTVTDANMILGILNHDSLLGGRLKVDPQRSLDAIGPIAAHVGVAPAEAAEGIYRIVNANIAAAIRQVTVEKGIDPRDFTLVAFGGAGGQHAVPVAQEIGIRHVLLPNLPSVFSAFGMVSANMSHSRAKTLMLPLSDEALGEACRAFDVLERDLIDVLEREDVVSQIDAVRSLDLRYRKQAHEIAIDFAPGDAAATLYHRFENRHRELYGTALGDEVVVVTVRTTVVGVIPILKLPPEEIRANGEAPPVQRRTPVHPNPQPVPVIERPTLKGGMLLPVPCLVEEADTVHYIPPGCRAAVDAWRNIRIDTERE